MKKIRLIAALALGAAASLVAQPVQPNDRIQIVTGATGSPMTVDIIGATATSISGRSVKGLPYAAESVSETTQTLADGNKISRKTTSAVYRDSQGRSRTELAVPSVGPWATGGKDARMISIFDPVAKVNIMLHPDKTATRHAVPSFDGGGNATWTEATSTAGRQTRTMVFTRRMDTSANEKNEEIVIERGPTPGGAAVFVGSTRMRTGAAIAGQALPDSKHTFRKESLGKKVIEGVEAEGTRIVSVIPAGEIGNERDIEIVDETWYSKEIEALVYSRHADPQTGETSYRLTNIQRGEQPLHLFEVPSDYKLMEGPGKIEFKTRRDTAHE